MTFIMKPKTACRCVLVALLLPLQTTNSQTTSFRDSLNGRWEMRVKARTTVERNDNVFRLSTHQQTKMSLNDSGSVVSGRFRDMENVSDFISASLVEFEASTAEGLFGRPIALSATVEYSHYFQNPKKDYVEFGLSLLQHLTKLNRVRIRAHYTPSTFSKNYLADVTDLTGNVSSRDRVYRAGIYREWEASLEFQRRFRTVPLTVSLLGGYRSQTFEQPFTGRNERGLSIGLATAVELTRIWVAELAYGFETVKSPAGPEVLILNEPDYEIDFNNDRDFVDLDRRTVQTVDRSHRLNEIGFSTAVDPTKRLTVRGGVKYLWKNYSSREPINPSYKDRRDTRVSVNVEVDYRLFLRFHLRGEFKRVHQATNRPQDPDYLGETTDYDISIIRAGVVWRLN